MKMSMEFIYECVKIYVLIYHPRKYLSDNCANLFLFLHRIPEIFVSWKCLQWPFIQKDAS
jgi:hypothetical protein